MTNEIKKIKFFTNNYDPGEYTKETMKKYKRTRDINEAKKWINDGENVYLMYTKNSYRGIATFHSETINDIIETEGEPDEIVIESNSEKIILQGFDDNKRRIHVNCWRLIKDKMFADVLFDQKQVMKLVEAGEFIRAEDYKIRTGAVIRFIDDNTFETWTGSMYQIV